MTNETDAFRVKVRAMRAGVQSQELRYRLKEIHQLLARRDDRRQRGTRVLRFSRPRTMTPMHEHAS
jgi:hypothetical protein